MKREKSHADDPRLTAYALGELEGEERAEIEALLEENEEARELVEATRALASSLEAQLAAESAPGLSAEQRRAIEERAARGRGRRTARLLSWRSVAAVALAASVLGIAGLWATRPEVGVFGRRAAQAPAGSAWKPQLSVPANGRYVRRLDFGFGADSEAAQITMLERSGYTGAEGTVSAPPEADGPARRFDRDGDEVELLLRSLGYVDSAERSTEEYERIVENPFFPPRFEPLSTFSIDVDSASYANVRRFLKSGTRPPPDAVRIEELVNYFPYAYAGPGDAEAPFAVHVEVTQAPWQPAHRLVRIGLASRAIDARERRPANLVFLLDVSGSMNDAAKLPLLKRALEMLVLELGERDRVAIAVYAGSSGLVLPSTPASYKVTILESLERLGAGGSTNGGEGIQLAYRVARKSFLEGGINRVILATDGDFNVGVTSDGALERLIEEEAQSGVFLTVLGFGTGNLKDAKMEKLSNRGNGNYAYIDSLLEARKVLVEELGATLETIAKDVKIQVEFNPLEVAGYRLIGYENRILQHQDFDDDTKDAGEIGAGHTVTALYEVVPAGRGLAVPGEPELRYQGEREASAAAFAGELLTVNLRYKEPTGTESRLLALPVRDDGKAFHDASEDTRFAASVAAFGMLLRGSAHCGAATFADVRTWALESRGDDEGGYRAEFLELVELAAD